MIPTTRRTRRRNRGRLCASEKRCTGIFGARTGLRFYIPDTGRWLSGDPIQEEGGLNICGFAENDPVSNQDVLGLYSLRYFSEGRVYLDVRIPANYHVIRRFRESGVRNTSDAFFYQWIEQKRNCPGGVCNSGGTGTSSSFITASVMNNSICTLDVTCQCRIQYKGRTWTITRSGGFTAKGEVLGTPFNNFHRSVVQRSGPLIGWSVADARKVIRATQTFRLAPGARHKLYDGYFSVAIPPDQIGSGFSENMNGDCRCSAVKAP